MQRKKVNTSQELLDNHLDPEIQFESIDIDMDQKNDQQLISDVASSNDIKNNNNKPKSALSKITSSISSKLQIKKIQKAGFSQINDDELSDPTDIDIINDDVNDIDIDKSGFKCTKRCTIIIITIIVIAFLALFIGVVITNFESASNNNPNNVNCMKGRKVLIISLDGFRSEYLDRIDVPNIKKYFIDEGFRVKSMKPVFPSKTFPNHYTIVTGLYPPSHGIVSNHFWDPILKKPFDIQYQGADPTGNWYFGEPIWNTIKLKNLSSAGLQYPGTMANCGGRMNTSGYPTYHLDNYNFSWSYNERIDLTVDLLSSTDPVYDLLLLYFEEPDHHGHQYGPMSSQVGEIVRTMDGYIGRLIDKMMDNNLLDITDIILLSDHGMTEIEKYDPNTYLNDDSKIIVSNTSIFPFDTFDFIIRDWSPVMGVYINESSDFYGHVDDAMNLMKLSLYHNGDKCAIYKNGEIPYITYNNPHEYHNRIPDFIVDSDLGYSIYVEGHNTLDLLGTHGYNNAEDDMQAIFMGRGPSFKSGYSTETIIENVDLYELFCHILCEVNPHDNNGSMHELEILLENPPTM